MQKFNSLKNKDIQKEVEDNSVTTNVIEEPKISMNESTKAPVAAFLVEEAPVAVEVEKPEEPSIKKFNFILVNHNPCLGYKKGNVVRDDALIQNIIDKGHLRNFIKSTH